MQYYTKGQHFYQNNNFPAAIDSFTKAIRTQTELFSSHLYRALSYKSLRQYAKALEDYDLAVQI